MTPLNSFLMCMAFSEPKSKQFVATIKLAMVAKAKLAVPAEKHMQQRMIIMLSKQTPVSQEKWVIPESHRQNTL